MPLTEGCGGASMGIGALFLETKQIIIMSINKATGQVLEFHKAFEQPIGEKMGFPDEERIKLRISLMREELKEIEEGIGNRNLPNVLKEFCDLQFVLLGSVLEFGLHNVFKQAFDEVYASNMSKSLPTHEEAFKEAVTTYEEKGILTKINDSQDGSSYITRLSDDKVLKPSTYMAANMDQFFEYESEEGHGI